MKVRAKLICVSVAAIGVTENVPESKTGENVKFQTQYNTADSPEDNSFSVATPAAEMIMQIDNPACFGAFEEGKAYYFDICAVPAQ